MSVPAEDITGIYMGSCVGPRRFVNVILELGVESFPPEGGIPTMQEIGEALFQAFKNRGFTSLGLEMSKRVQVPVFFEETPPPVDPEADA